MTSNCQLDGLKSAADEDSNSTQIQMETHLRKITGNGKCWGIRSSAAQKIIRAREQEKNRKIMNFSV